MTDPAGIDQPIAWRVWWKLPAYRPCDTEFEPHAHWQKFPTLEAAEARKQALEQHFRGKAAVCITPVYPSRRARQKLRAEQQLSLAAHWPLQTKRPLS